MKYYLLLLLFIFCSAASGQDSDPYDLKFEKYSCCKFGWDWLKHERSARISPSYDSENERNYLHFSYERYFFPEMEFTLRKEIVLKREVSGTASIEFDAKGEYVKDFSVSIITLDKENRQVDTRKVDIQLNKTWEKKKVEFPLGGAYAFQLVFDYKGNASSGQKISLGETKIDINKKPLYAFLGENRSGRRTKQAFKGQSLQSLRDEESFQNAEIIGIGESTHGSKTISDEIFAYMKSMVQDGSSKLILLEAPYATALIPELYIQNKLDTALVDLAGYLDLGMDKETRLPFLEWLRLYNDTTTSGRVHIFGVDNEGLSTATLSDFYLGLIGQEKAVPYLNIIYSDEAKKTLPALDHAELKTALGDTETYRYFVDLLSEGSEMYEHQRFEDRDSLMYTRVRRLHEKFGTKGLKTLVVAHSLHIQKSEHIYKEAYEKPLGYLLARDYGDQYYALNFSFGTGEVLQDSCSRAALSFDKLMVAPPNESFEQLALAAGIDSEFLPTRSISRPMRMLMIPRRAHSEHIYTFKNLQNSFDGIFFTRTSEPLTYQQGSQAIHRNTHFNRRKKIHEKILNDNGLEIHVHRI